MTSLLVHYLQVKSSFVQLPDGSQPEKSKKTLGGRPKDLNQDKAESIDFDDVIEDIQSCKSTDIPSVMPDCSDSPSATERQNTNNTEEYIEKIKVEQAQRSSMLVADASGACHSLV